jgi:hypothetical protein
MLTEALKDALASTAPAITPPSDEPAKPEEPVGPAEIPFQSFVAQHTGVVYTAYTDIDKPAPPKFMGTSLLALTGAVFGWQQRQRAFGSAPWLARAGSGLGLNLKTCLLAAGALVLYQSVRFAAKWISSHNLLQITTAARHTVEFTGETWVSPNNRPLIDRTQDSLESQTLAEVVVTVSSGLRIKWGDAVVQENLFVPWRTRSRNRSVSLNWLTECMRRSDLYSSEEADQLRNHRIVTQGAAVASDRSDIFVSQDTAALALLIMQHTRRQSEWSRPSVPQAGGLARV